MNPRWLVLLIVMCLIPGALAADLIVDTKLVKDIKYESFERSVIAPLLELFGLSEKPLYNKGVAVYQGETQLAVLPEGSPLIDIKVHDYCLQNFGYGTDAFIICEGTI